MDDDGPSSPSRSSKQSPSASRSSLAGANEQEIRQRMQQLRVFFASLLLRSACPDFSLFIISSARYTSHMRLSQPPSLDTHCTSASLLGCCRSLSTSTALLLRCSAAALSCASPASPLCSRTAEAFLGNSAGSRALREMSLVANRRPQRGLVRRRRRTARGMFPPRSSTE